MESELVIDAGPLHEFVSTAQVLSLEKLGPYTFYILAMRIKWDGMFRAYLLGVAQGRQCNKC